MQTGSLGVSHLHRGKTACSHLTGLGRSRAGFHFGLVRVSRWTRSTAHDVSSNQAAEQRKTVAPGMSPGFGALQVISSGGAAERFFRSSGAFGDRIGPSTHSSRCGLRSAAPPVLGAIPNGFEEPGPVRIRLTVRHPLSRNDAVKSRSGFQPDPESVEESDAFKPALSRTVGCLHRDFADRLEALSYLASSLSPALPTAWFRLSGCARSGTGLQRADPGWRRYFPDQVCRFFAKSVVFQTKFVVSLVKSGIFQIKSAISLASP